MRGLALLLIWASAAAAGAPEQSLRPPLHAAETQIASVSVRPVLRPADLAQNAMSKRRAERRGSVCGERAIQGEVVGLIPGRIAGCGIENAVQITSVSGIVLSQPALMTCPTAEALRRWVDKSAKPAFRSKGGGLSGLRVAAHYACRTRNSQRGARISEHGKGRAIDISGFVLRDGSTVTVLEGWTARGSRRALRKVHKGACGPFGTVLGPESDRFHRNHFHFDTARYRSGPYCR